METLRLPVRETQRRGPLETSLVEWKQNNPDAGFTPLFPLETSLVEWKLFFGGEGAALCFSLETSLVEWKQCAPGGEVFCASTPWKLP